MAKMGNTQGGRQCFQYHLRRAVQSNLKESSDLEKPREARVVLEEA